MPQQWSSDDVPSAIGLGGDHTCPPATRGSPPWRAVGQAVHRTEGAQEPDRPESDFAAASSRIRRTAVTGTARGPGRSTPFGTARRQHASAEKAGTVALVVHQVVGGIGENGEPVGTRARRCGEAARGGGDRWRRWRSGTGRSCGPRPPSGWTCRPPRRGAARDAGCGSSSPGGPADRRLRRALPEGERGAALARVLPGPIGPVRRGGRWGRRGSSCTSCLTRTGRAGCGRPSCRRCGPGAGRRRHAARPR